MSQKISVSEINTVCLNSLTEPYCAQAFDDNVRGSLALTYLVDSSVHLQHPRVQLRSGVAWRLGHHAAHLCLLLRDLLHDDVG